jgi:NADPH:quinone reductase-like Zn-dependent oxidoreductase
MKAIVFKQYGEPNVLHIAEVETPTPADNELLIRVRAAEVTKADCEIRSFTFAVKWFWLPMRLMMGIRKPKKPILGGYFAGVVEGIGKNVTEFSLGDELFGSSGILFGAYAEYMCVPANNTLAIKPNNISFAEAAAIPLGGLNALHFLNRANIQPGDKVLINGAGGSIGIFAVQIAKARGAEVTAVDSGIKEDMLRGLGVDHFFDYNVQNFADLATTYDVIFNMVAQSSYSTCVNKLKPNGRYLMGNPRLSDMLKAVFTSKFSTKKAMFAFAGEKIEELLALKKMAEQGKIQFVIDTVFPPERVAEAHLRVQGEQRKGMVILNLGFE